MTRVDSRLCGVHSGKLSREELAALKSSGQSTSQLFDSLDMDKDGLLDFNEMKPMMGMGGGGMGKAPHDEL